MLYMYINFASKSIYDASKQQESENKRLTGAYCDFLEYSLL